MLRRWLPTPGPAPRAAQHPWPTQLPCWPPPPHPPNPTHPTPNPLGAGTHVAGTAIGLQVGVAKEAEVVAVRILDCTGSGTISDTVAGLDWVAGEPSRGGGGGTLADCTVG